MDTPQSAPSLLNNDKLKDEADLHELTSGNLLSL